MLWTSVPTWTGRVKVNQMHARGGRARGDARASLQAPAEQGQTSWHRAARNRLRQHQYAISVPHIVSQSADPYAISVPHIYQAQTHATCRVRRRVQSEPSGASIEKADSEKGTVYQLGEPELVHSDDGQHARRRLPLPPPLSSGLRARKKRECRKTIHGRPGGRDRGSRQQGAAGC